MKKALLFGLALILGMIFCTTAGAHFGMVIPSDSMVMMEDDRTVRLQVSFSHPFEGIGMDMERPKAFGVVADGGRQELLGSLQQSRVMGRAAWQADYRIKRPGAYLFYLEPTPYWEPAEDVYIVHYTKTVVAAFGEDEGWDGEVGLPTEIVPLSKPFGLYAGNVFQGIVKLDGKPVPYAEVEVEYYNEDGRAKAPTEYMITQTIKADENGVFTYAAPRSGWWGFAALNEADFTIPFEGQEKGVEIGAVIWVKFEKWQ
ncbi:MAG: DUF4198 domain-containing protein [Desulfobacterales bacterium]|nr:DUF4198 domain-containing protein [Desulfobacterales bacterium]